MPTRPGPAQDPPLDYVIVGAGVAGLSLARRLAPRLSPGQRLLLIDGRRHDADRTFAFWTDAPTPIDDLLWGAWHTLRICSDAAQQELALEPWRYVALSESRLREAVLLQLAQIQGAECVAGRVDRIEHGRDADVVVLEGGQRLAARWVFDSRSHEVDGSGLVSLRQRFRGWWIETPEPAFDPDVATLMDFRAPQGQGLGFYYLLPAHPRRALVMAVHIGSDPHPPPLRPYVQRLLGDAWTVVSEERGSTPATDHRFVRRAGLRTVRIGISGGQLRPSTGYAFQRIQRDSDAIVGALLRHGAPLPVSTDPWVLRTMDAIMLTVVARHPGATAPLFYRLFEGNPIHRVLRFLDDRPSWRDVVGIVRSLPPWWFVAAALRRLAARLGLVRL